MRVLSAGPVAYEGRGRGRSQLGKSMTERGIAAARALLGDARIVTFLRAVYVREQEQVSGKPTTALRIAVRDLQKGTDLNELFVPWDMPGEKFKLGFKLRAKQLPDGRYEIEFGCNAGGNAGDGGAWLVAFGEGDQVLSIESLGWWIA